MSTAVKNRRIVSGLAYKNCEFCGVGNQDKKTGKFFNYQFFNESTNTWEEPVYCSKMCRNAWYNVNHDARL